MSKQCSVENFYIGDDFVHCYTTWTRNGFCHHAEYYDSNLNLVAKKRVSYINRTWERFDYESTLLAIALRLPQSERMGLEAFCATHARKVAEECEKWLDGFKSIVGKLSDEQRNSVAKAVGHIDTEEKANAAFAMAAMLAASAQ